MPSTNRDEPQPPPDRDKAVLFCPECGHESPLSGDWRTTRTDGDRLLVCAVCGTVVDRRPRTDPAASVEAR